MRMDQVNVLDLLTLAMECVEVLKTAALVATADEAISNGVTIAKALRKEREDYKSGKNESKRLTA